MRALRFAPLLALAIAATTAPAHAEEGDKDKSEALPASEGRYPPFSTRFKVLAAGVAITGTAWGITYAAARGWPEQACVVSVAGPIMPGTGVGNIPPVFCSSGPPGSNQLGIPIVGPWIALAKSGCASDEPNCTIAKPIARGIAYVVDGAIQLAGLGLIVEALVMKTESSAEPARKSSPLALRFRGMEVTPLPVVSPTMSGLSLTGTF